MDPRDFTITFNLDYNDSLHHFKYRDIRTSQFPAWANITRIACKFTTNIDTG